MMLAVGGNYCESMESSAPQAPVSLLLGLGRAELERASKAEPREESPLKVAIEDVTCEGEDSPVKYTMRLTSVLSGASWKIPPRRYSDFEVLHKSVRSYDSLQAELPPKYLLVPSRSALVQRAAGLQRYCNALLCTPAALGRAEVADFFDLDKGLWRRTRAATDEERSAALVRLQGACRRHVASGQRASRATTKAAQVEAEAQADRAIANTPFGSPKRSAPPDLATGAAEPASDGAEAVAGMDTELAGASRAKRVRGSPPPAKSPARERLVEPRQQGAARTSVPCSPELAPAAGPLSAASAMWGERERCGTDAAASGELDVAETPSTADALFGIDGPRLSSGKDVPLRRSGVSDVMAAVGF